MNGPKPHFVAIGNASFANFMGEFLRGLITYDDILFSTLKIDYRSIKLIRYYCSRAARTVARAVLLIKPRTLFLAVAGKPVSLLFVRTLSFAGVFSYSLSMSAPSRAAGNGHGEELSRDAFVAALVSQLRENEAALAAENAAISDAAGDMSSFWRQQRESDSGVEAQHRRAKDAFHKLAFDFPIVSDLDLSALAHSLVQTDSTTPSWFWISPEVLKGVLYILEDKAATGAAEGARESLLQINVQLRLRALERVLAADTLPLERRRLLLGPEEIQESTTVGADIHAALVDRLCSELSAVGYQSFGDMSVEEWDDLFITGTLYRILRSLLALKENSAGFFDETGAFDKDDLRLPWVAEAQATWPHFLLLLRDRLTDRPQSMRTVLPALMEMSEVCHAYCLKVSADQPDPDLNTTLGAHGNPVMLGVLKTLVSEDALSQASLQEKSILWEALNQGVVPRARVLLEEALKRNEEDGAQAREQARGLLDILSFYAQGNPRRGLHGASQAVDTLHKSGVVRAAVAAWAKGNFGAASVDDPLGSFLWTCALRSSEVLGFVLLIPGFCARLGSEEMEAHPHGAARRLAWAILIATSVKDESIAKRARLDFSAPAGASWPNSKEAFADYAMFAIGALLQDPAEKSNLKKIAAIIGVLDEGPVILRVLHDGAFGTMLLATLKQVSRVLMKTPTQTTTPSTKDPSQLSVGPDLNSEDARKSAGSSVDVDSDQPPSSSPLTSLENGQEIESDKANLENPSLGTQQDEEAQIYADSLVRVRLLVKRFMCKLQGAPAKAD